MVAVPSNWSYIKWPQGLYPSDPSHLVVATTKWHGGGDHDYTTPKLCGFVLAIIGALGVVTITSVSLLDALELVWLGPWKKVGKYI